MNASASYSNAQSLQEIRLLIVDDDAIFRERLSKALVRRGISVESASDASAAKSKLEREVFSHALIDLNMPGEDGLALLRHIHAHPRSMTTVVLTGYGSIATALDAIRIGAKDYLTKPCDARRILDALGIEELTEKHADDLSVPSLSQVEWDHIQRVLHDHDGNVTQAAKVLGMHRRSLQRKLSKAPGKLI